MKDRTCQKRTLQLQDPCILQRNKPSVSNPNQWTYHNVGHCNQHKSVAKRSHCKCEDHPLNLHQQSKRLPCLRLPLDFYFIGRRHHCSTPIFGIQIRSRENQESHTKGSQRNCKETTNETSGRPWSPFLKQNRRSGVWSGEYHLHAHWCCGLTKVSKSTQGRMYPL